MHIAFTLRLPTEASSIPVVRGLCRTTLTQLGAREQSVDDIALAVTEACTNVVQHAAAGLHVGAPNYEVRVELDGTRCVLTVADTGSGFDSGAVRVSEVEELLGGGRGITLMRALVDELQFEPSAPGGTVVQLTKALDVDDGSPLRDLHVEPPTKA